MKWTDIEAVEKMKTLEEFEEWEKKEKEEELDYRKMTRAKIIESLEKAKRVHDKLKKSDRIVKITKHYIGNSEEMKKVTIEMKINGKIKQKTISN